jgi:hypothetical protein
MIAEREAKARRIDPVLATSAGFNRAHPISSAFMMSEA